MPLLYERLRTYLLDEIRSGNLQPGDRVPSEKELAEQFHVSRITSKKALELLSQEGVVIRSRGRGTFVTHRTAHTTGSPDGSTRSSLQANASLPTGVRRIGFIVPDYSDVFGVRMLDAIEERCTELDLQFVLRRTRGRRDAEAAAITSFVQSGIDGLIVFPVHGEYYNDELLRIVLGGFPVVLVDRYLKGIAVSSVCTDNYAASRAITSHLIAEGHRQIAFLSPPPERTSSIEDRRRGFSAALREHDYPVISDQFLMNLSSTLPGADRIGETVSDSQRLRDFVLAHPETTAYLACEYTLALLLDRELTALDRPSRRPAIACFDSPEEPFGHVRFTHIRQNERAIGKTAVDTLIGQIESGAAASRAVIDFDLVPATERGSAR